MAIRANLVIDQGADFEATINITDDNDQIVNLVGYTGSAQMRKHYSSITSYSFIVDIIPHQGAVTLSMHANTSANIIAGRYVYDCELRSNTGIISRLIEGIVTITPNVTR